MFRNTYLPIQFKRVSEPFILHPKSLNHFYSKSANQGSARARCSRQRWGTMYDSQLKTAVPDAGIKLKDSNYRADENGYFNIVLNPGVYSFTALYINLNPIITKEFSLIAGDSLNLIFYLKPDSTPYINRVLVILILFQNVALSEE